MKAGISVIICCHNSKNRLPKVFDCLEKQKDLQDIQWEILIIDNASTDNTAGYVEEYSRNHNLLIVLLQEPRMGLSYARKTGIDAASFELICYIDDDNWVNEKYISAIYHLMMNKSDIGLCGGQGIPAFESTPPWWFESFQNAYAVGPQGNNLSGYMTEETNHLYGAGMTIRKSAWLHLQKNGFSYKLTGRKGEALSSGEDSELSFALQLAGYKLWYEPTLSFYHFMPEGRLNYNYLKKLFKAFGKSDVVITIYQSHFRHFGRLKKLIVHDYFLCLFYNLYGLIKLCFTYLVKKKGPAGKMHYELSIIRSASKFTEHLTMFGSYSTVCKSISQSVHIAANH
jgi:glycosyltransferase involved in cell wall biosynthesis